jgi:hypothetical protein
MRLVSIGTTLIAKGGALAGECDDTRSIPAHRSAQMKEAAN